MPARVLVQLATTLAKTSGQGGIQSKARQAPGGWCQPTEWRTPVTQEKCGCSGQHRSGIKEKVAEPQPCQNILTTPADEFPTNAVPGKRTGFPDDHGHLMQAQADPK